MMFCSYENATNMANPRVSGLPIPGFLIPFVAKRLAEAVKYPQRKPQIFHVFEARKRLSAEGTLRHPREVTIEVLRRDLEALTALLGDKKFFIGIRPTVVSEAFNLHPNFFRIKSTKKSSKDFDAKSVFEKQK